MQRGAIHTHRFQSRVLKSNPLNDPSVRDLIVYLPPGYTQSDSRGYVASYFLSGFGGTGRMLLNFDPMSENLEQRMNRLISSRKCGPMICVLVDCFTKLGGNQYINSVATGQYEDYIVKEIVPYIDANYNVRSRAIVGKSSGGYGSIVIGMRNPRVFHALADHSGDSAFEYCYLPDLPKAMDALREAGGAARWLERFRRKKNKKDWKDNQVLNIVAMAAHYSPNLRSKDLGIDLPFDVETGEFREDVWRRWLAWDPVRMVRKYRENLKKLKFIYLDCGSRDEFNLHWGARLLHLKLKEFGVKHHYEEFDDGHMNISYRYDVSIPMIYGALSEGQRVWS